MGGGGGGGGGWGEGTEEESGGGSAQLIKLQLKSTFRPENQQTRELISARNT